mgnify:CR=1 FL=1
MPGDGVGRAVEEAVPVAGSGAGSHEKGGRSPLFVAVLPKRLLVLELGLALFDEGGHAFFLVVEGEGGVEDAAFEEEAFVEAGFEGAVDGLLDHHDHRQRVAGDGGGGSEGFFDELVGRDDAGDEAGFFGFGCVHQAGGEAQVHGLAFADGAGQTLGAAGAGEGAELDFGLAELCGVGGEDHVAAHGELTAAAEGEAVHCRDHRLVEALHVVEELDKRGILKNLPVVPKNVMQLLVNLESITQKIIDNEVTTAKTITDVNSGLKTGDANKLKAHAGQLKEVTKTITAIIPKA